MPSKVVKRGSKWAVVEKSSGKVKSQHDTRRKAEGSRRIRDSAREKK
ncbi:hypothetical protein LCGC14_0393920 [marine sediment metagenome]|uniref:Uncharacterized protein n=1 Tax=marine sediment metagenome TaxID=412755 RepID=A0A0F9TGM4_9ZZZZ